MPLILSLPPSVCQLLLSAICTMFLFCHRSFTRFIIHQVVHSFSISFSSFHFTQKSCPPLLDPQCSLPAYCGAAGQFRPTPNTSPLPDLRRPFLSFFLRLRHFLSGLFPLKLHTHRTFDPRSFSAPDRQGEAFSLLSVFSFSMGY